MHCPTCKTTTEHHLNDHTTFFNAVCNVCGGITAKYTHQELVSALLKKFAPSEPPMEISTVAPNSVRVFIKHHLGEAEASEALVRAHVRITGKLPGAGDKLMCLPLGIPHKAFAIPIAEVVRVEPILER